MSYQVFRRSWWQDPYCKIPVDRLSRGTTIEHVETEEEAREACRAFNCDAQGNRIRRPYGVAYEYEEA
jgi:hypothetical protein